MDFRKLGNALMILGAAVLIGAVIWWMTFYNSIARDIGKATGARPDAGLSDVVSCLYSTGGICVWVQTGATFVGKTPYEPMTFWFGLAALLLGGLIRYTAKPGGAAPK